jgi:DNA-binding transcriptional LysR family regulator
MPRPSLDDLVTFCAVAEARSFTKAAAQAGVSPSALSHAIRGLEARLGVRLLTRTTRSVALTEAGERLLATVAPRVAEIEAEVEAVGALRHRPSGTIRITTSGHAAESRLWPALAPLLPRYPELKVEISVNAGFIETIAQDMVAVRIGPDMRMAAVAAPAYFAAHPPPRTPQDLSAHSCINLRFPTHGGLYAWEFEKDGRALSVRVEGQMVVNEIALAVKAAVDGAGVAYLPDDYVAAELRTGVLTRALEDWCPPFPGYHLYYPSRRQQSPAMALLVEALRFRGR